MCLTHASSARYSTARMSAIDSYTRLCGIIGNPVEHSLSPAIHNAAFQHMGLNFVYLAFKVEDLEGAIRGIRALSSIRGVSVTIPHKIAVLPYLDKISATAENIGAVNTIVSDQGLLSGYNTDASGALAALKAAGAMARGRFLLLGSGGAARAIAFGLCMEANISSLTILAMIDEEREALVRDLRNKTRIPASGFQLTPDTMQRHIPQQQVLIHCTPVGMSPKTQESCVPQHLLVPPLTVMDIVYNPLETRLLADARQAGCQTISGIEMFLHQAIAQFELWAEKPAPAQVMRAVLERHFTSERAGLERTGEK
jgi:shikimate dehydrogenase